MNEATRLTIAYDQLEPDARSVLVLIAERMVAGQGQYGRLDISTDTRNMLVEALEEAADLSVYLAIEMLRRSR